MCSLLQTTIWLAWILGGVFTLTLFCRGRIIHGGHISTTPDSARQSETSPPWCNTTRSSHGARPTAVARHRAQYRRALSVRRQTTQTDIRQIIYRQLRRRRTRSRFVDRREPLCSGCSSVSSSTQIFLFDSNYTGLRKTMQLNSASSGLPLPFRIHFTSHFLTF